MSAAPTAPGRLVCAVCGERLTRGRGDGTFSHVSRLVAACDLNSDHVPEPDWDLVGPLACRTCGAPVLHAAGRFTHGDPARDGDHDADPVLPVA